MTTNPTIVQPAAVTAFTACELLYVVETVGGTIAERARAQLGISVEPDDAVSLGAGLTSLFVRGMVSVSPDQVELAEAAAAVGYVLTSDPEWFEIVNVVGDLSDAAWLVRLQNLALFIRPQPLGTYQAQLVEPSEAANWLGESTVAFVSATEERATYITNSTHSTRAGLLVRQSEPGLMTVVNETGDLLVSEQLAIAGQHVHAAVSEFLSK